MKLLRVSKSAPRVAPVRCAAVAFSLVAATACGSEPAHDLDAVPFVDAVRTVRTGSFGTTIGLARTSDGVLHLLQGEAPAVTRIAPDGSIVDAAGEWGLAAGEYQNPVAIGARADSVWIVDRGTGRQTVYFDGALVRSDRLAMGESRHAVPLPQGAALGRLVDTGHDAPEAGPSSRVDHLVRLDDGTVVDTLAVLTTSSITTIRVFGSDRGGAVLSVGPSDFPLHAVDEGSGDLWVVERPFPRRSEARARLSRISPTGDTLASVWLRKSALPIPDAETAARLSERRAQLLPTLPWAEVEGFMPRPGYRAPASDFVVGSDGWMWLALEEVPGDAQRTWVLLDPAGTPRVRTRLPANFAGHAADGESIAGIVRDDGDGRWVESYRIEG